MSSNFFKIKKLFYDSRTITDDFKRKYLAVNKHINLSTPDEIIGRWITLKEDYDKIDKEAFGNYINNAYNPKKSYQNSKKYREDFIKTIYWKIVADYVKLFKGNICQLDKSHDNKYLEIHHNNYDILGWEIESLSDLMCLCAYCHGLHHGQENKEWYAKNYTRNSEYVASKKLEQLETKINELNNGEINNNGKHILNLKKSVRFNEINVLELIPAINNDDISLNSAYLKFKAASMRFNAVNNDLKAMMR